MLEKLKQLADGANYPAQKEVLEWAVKEIARLNSELATQPPQQPKGV
jgi:hypothetical protein